MNWTDLTTYERKALIELLTGHHKVRARVPEDQSLLDKGLLLEDLDLGVHLSELGFNLTAEYIMIPATTAPTDDLAALQAENKRLREILGDIQLVIDDGDLSDTRAMLRITAQIYRYKALEGGE